MPVALSLFLVLFFLLMNAFFVVAEFSLVRVRKSQVEMAVDEGKAGSKYAKLVADNVNAYLSACQLGITLASLALGWLGEPAVSALIHPALAALGLPDAAISAIAVAIGFIIITALHIVVGELIPKSLAIFSTETLCAVHGRAARVVLPHHVSHHVAVQLHHQRRDEACWATTSANEHEVYTEEEIQLLIDESLGERAHRPRAARIRGQHLRLGRQGRRGHHDAAHRASSAWTRKTRWRRTWRPCVRYKYTRYPVCRGQQGPHRRVRAREGPLHAAGQQHDGRPAHPRPSRPCPKACPSPSLLQTLQEKRTKIAVVVDEHGGTAGIVTMSDIMEQIVGRIDDEYRHGGSDEVVTLDDGSYLIDGSLPIDEVEDLIGFVPEEASECETAGGLLLTLFDRIPDEGDTVSVSDRRRHGDVHRRVTWTGTASTRYAWLRRLASRRNGSMLRSGEAPNLRAMPKAHVP